MEAEDDNQGDGEVEEEALVPDEISDEFFENLVVKINGLIKEIQAEQKFTLAEELLRTLTVAQRLRIDVAAEKDKILVMRDEVTAASGRIAAAMKLSQTDNETIERLKIEIDNAWKQTDIAHGREQSAHEQMGIIREKLSKLQADSEKFVEKKDTNEELGSSLAKHKEGILRERDRLNGEVEELNRRLQIQRTYGDEVEKKRQESEKKLKELYKLLDATSDEAFKEKKMIEMLKIQLSETTSDRDAKDDEAKHYKAQADTYQRSASSLHTELTHTKVSLEKTKDNLKNTTDRLGKILGDLDFCTQMKQNLTHELAKKTNLLNLREDENKKYSLEISKVIKSKELLMKKMTSIKMQKAVVEQDILKYKNMILTFEKERDALKKSAEIQNKELEKLIRDRDTVRRDLMKANRTIGEQADATILHKQHVKTLENEIISYVHNEKMLRLNIAKIEKERDRAAEETQILTDKVETVTEELHQKVAQIEQLRENVTVLTVKVSNIQTLFETARSERNAFQRELQACVEDRDDLRERLKIGLRQIEQLQEDIANKERELLQAEKTIMKLEKDKQALKYENQNILVQLQHTKSELREKNAEIGRLHNTISEDELRITKLRKELDNALNERDLIGTQLIRRNDEIGLLNEKLSIIQMAVDRGESQYNKRVDDIRLLKIEIANLRSQRNLLTRGLANTADMRQEVLQLHRVLTQERVKAKALEEEMTTPMNIHRWRKLEGKDPDKLDMVVKIQSLQKRLLLQTVHATEKDQEVEESKKVYATLKDIVAKLPDESAKGKLNATKHALDIKTKKLKALTAELNAKDMDEKAQECKIVELKTKLTETKKELLRQKKEKEKLSHEHIRNNSAQQLQSDGQNTYPGYRTMGSGFKIPA